MYIDHCSVFELNSTEHYQRTGITVPQFVAVLIW